jgi:alanine-synthesizing transaminase
MFARRTNWELATNRLSDALTQYRASGKRLIDLAASNPTECEFVYDDDSILRALCNPAALSYAPDPKGLLSARKAVAAYYADRGETVSPQQICLATSTSEAYSYIFRTLCDPGDELLIPTPSYPLFDFLADVNDVKLVRYPLLYDHGWQIDFHALEQALTDRTRGIIVVHPNNPTGHFCKPGEAARLNEICAARGLALIVDEVFLDFAIGFDPKAQRPASFVANGSTLTFTLSGLSKISGMPQMKIAWLVASGPSDLVWESLNRIEVIADTYLSLNTPLQLAAPDLLQQRHEFQRQILARVRANLDELDRQLKTQPLCERLQVEGGWYAIIRVPVTRTDEELAIEMLNTKGVYFHPGHFYDLPQDGYLVISLITPETKFSEGIRLLLSTFARAQQAD